MTETVSVPVITVICTAVAGFVCYLVGYCIGRLEIANIVTQTMEQAVTDRAKELQEQQQERDKNL